MHWTNLEMAKNTLDLIADKSVVNLGIGLPSLIADIPTSKKIVIHSENGILGVGGRPKKGTASPTLINAAKETISATPGSSFFDSSLSFSMVRGGHIDTCVLGGMQVDIAGSLANWMIPGKKVTGMGGAMDLVNGPKNVIVLMKHHNKSGESKLVSQCNLPLTGKSCVDFVVTELGVFEIKNKKFKIKKCVSLKIKKELLQDSNFIIE